MRVKLRLYDVVKLYIEQLLYKVIYIYIKKSCKTEIIQIVELKISIFADTIRRKKREQRSADLWRNQAAQTGVSMRQKGGVRSSANRYLSYAMRFVYATSETTFKTSP